MNLSDKNFPQMLTFSILASSLQSSSHTPADLHDLTTEQLIETAAFLETTLLIGKSLFNLGYAGDLQLSQQILDYKTRSDQNRESSLKAAAASEFSLLSDNSSSLHELAGSKNDFPNQRIETKQSIALDKDFSCNLCEFRTSERSKLLQHQVRHFQADFKAQSKSSTATSSNGNFSKPTRIFACNQCSYQCVRRANLIRHFRVHSGEKPFRCDKCPYRCSDKSNMRAHKRAIHSDA